MKCFRLTLFVVLLFSNTGFFSASPSLFVDQPIYADVLGSGWSNWSWAAVNLSNTSPIYSGTKSISVTFGGWEGLYLHNPGVNTLGFTDLRFFLHGGTSGGQVMNVYLTLEVDGSTVNGPSVAVIPPAANTWQERKIPLSSLNPTNQQITGVVWQAASGSAQPTVYFDEIGFYRYEDPDAPQISDVSLSVRSLPADGFTQTVIKAAVNDPQGLGNLSQVRLDTGELNRGKVVLLDDGNHNDDLVNDGVFGTAISVPVGTATGEVQLLLEAVDADGHEHVEPVGTLTILSLPGGSIPSVLPQRIGWGSNQWSEAAGQDWQVNSGVSWDYIYQYITYGWEGWGEHFVSRFVNQAWEKGYVPAVTVYLMLDTPPNCGETSNCYAEKLKNSSTVNAYLESLQRAALEAKGDQPVVFILEPDFYGYMQQLSNDPYNRPSGVLPNDPNSYPVALNRSGYANTLAGFGKYMVDLIHQTAPNALVAPMASMWATNGDPQSVTTQQAVEMAQMTAAFINQMGGAQADLLVVEFSDRDAGYYEVVHGRNTWWDDTDLTLPRVTRAFLWENALSVASGKRLLLWQVPVGNMDLDNTCDHYKDNRAAYLFNHPRDIFDSGVIGVMFGGGAACTTNVNTDGGYVASQGAIAYLEPSSPEHFSVLFKNGAVVTARWDEVSDPDLWGYRLYYRFENSDSFTVRTLSRANQGSLFLPYQGEWQIGVRSMDAMGNESPLSNLVTVVIDVESEHVFLPLIIR
ncbi:MAG: hypothetical protein CL609_09690 [Anaerolineaceae bacterium]|nr:hypothetical protein [Anaerolineaceae bacterium]